MLNFRSFALAAGGIAIFAAAAALTVSLTVVAGAVLSASLLARMMMAGRAPQPVYARAKTASRREMRVWNDGRGTIIDL